MRNDYYSCPEPYPSGTACYPRKVTLVVKYWQKRMSGGALRQRLVTAKVFLEDWALLPTRAADGHASRPTYELSIAFVPADWIEILQYFSLGGTTYILFYLVIGFVLAPTRSATAPAVDKGFESKPQRHKHGCRFCQQT